MTTRDAWADAVGQVIWERRVALGLSQQAVADAFWGERHHIYAYEKAVRLPQIPTLASIASRLGWKLSELIAECERVQTSHAAAAE